MRSVLIAAAVIIGLGSVVQADIVDLGTAGPWHVAGGKNADDRRSCAMSTGLPRQRVLVIKIIEGEQGVIFQLTSPALACARWEAVAVAAVD
jgi:hypothetical protein